MVFNLQIQPTAGINVCIPAPLIRFRYLSGGAEVLPYSWMRVVHSMQRGNINSQLPIADVAAGLVRLACILNDLLQSPKGCFMV